MHGYRRNAALENPMSSETKTVLGIGLAVLVGLGIWAWSKKSSAATTGGAAAGGGSTGGGAQPTNQLAPMTPVNGQYTFSAGNTYVMSMTPQGNTAQTSAAALAQMVQNFTLLGFSNIKAFNIGDESPAYWPNAADLNTNRWRFQMDFNQKTSLTMAANSGPASMNAYFYMVVPASQS